MNDSLKELEDLVDRALELRLEFLNLWNMVIASYLAMVLKFYDDNS